MDSPFDHQYSTTAIVSANREMLSRFLVLRRFHRALSYRFMDGKAVTASSFLPLAHLDGHRLGGANVLEHQRLHDLGLINEVLMNIDKISCMQEKELSNFNAQVLRKLLAVEEDAANGGTISSWLEDGAVGNDSAKARESDDGLRLPLPHFGTLCFEQRTPERPGQGALPSNSFWTSEVEQGIPAAIGSLAAVDKGSPFLARSSVMSVHSSDSNRGLLDLHDYLLP